MPKFIPPSCYTKSSAEKSIFSRLRQDKKAENFTILHSLDLKSHPTQVQGEADFVIVMPGCGVIVAEVKGAKSIRYNNGNWYFTNSTEPEKSPFKQATENAHALRNFLWQQAPDLAECFIHAVVIAPYLSRITTTSPEWESWEFIGSEALQRGRSLAQALVSSYEQAYEAYIEKVRIPRQQYPERSPVAKHAEQLVSLLRPSFEIVESAQSRAGRLESALYRATQEQAGVLEAIEASNQLLVQGGAGTGKTLLAQQTALRSLQEGRSVLFLCFNRLLGQLIESQLNDATKKLETVPNYFVGTFHSYAVDIVKPTAYPKTTAEWNELVSLAIDSLLQQQNPEFDELVIDEAQDLLDERFLQLLDLSLKGGLKGGRCRIFGDFQRQKLFKRDNEVSIEDIQERLGSNQLVPVTLRNNCRNSPRVANLIERLCRTPEIYARCLLQDTEIDPTVHFFSSAHPQAEVLKQVCDSLLRENYRHHEIVVLSISSEETVTNMIRDAGLETTFVPYTLAETKHIRFASVRTFKGLEATAIVLIDLTTLDDDGDAYAHVRDLLYVGLSRSRERVALIADQRLKDDLTAVLSQVTGNRRFAKQQL